MTIVVNNNTWSKEKFLNYFVGTFKEMFYNFLDDGKSLRKV
ncbi:hypothetical protein Goshw_005121, partial [Gossypium schwendimanii]|nr:hypothetical protein [Gossypium schwendimanii]